MATVEVSSTFDGRMRFHSEEMSIPLKEGFSKVLWQLGGLYIAELLLIALSSQSSQSLQSLQSRVYSQIEHISVLTRSLC